MKTKKRYSQKMGKSFTIKQDCERFKTCFINTKTTNNYFNFENYKRGVFFHKTCKK